jgi:aldehyde:ferredoxin oxidoreductase
VLEWGDMTAVETLLHLLGKQEGFGIYLGEGAQSFARRFEAEDEAVQVNGLEAAYHDPRGASGMALVYATSPRGACHNQSDYYLVEVGQVEPAIGLERFSLREGARKAANVARHQDWRTLCNSLVLCFFSNVGPEMVLSLINSACGLEWSIEDMMRAGERGFNLKRVINHRLGLTRSNDTLPKRMLEPYPDYPDAYVPDFHAMLDAYYLARGWERETGFPSKAKLESLGLDWVLTME